MSKFVRPSATNIGTPVYHRRRRHWIDDRDLIEELAASVYKLDGPYDYYDKGVFAFREKIKLFRTTGYENNQQAFYLGSWLRERLGELSQKFGSYDLRVHTINFPIDLDDTISQIENRNEVEIPPVVPDSYYECLFPDNNLRNFARERTQVLHNGDLVAYLSSLVSKEQISLGTNSASIMDLIHICEFKLSNLGLVVRKKYVVGETDLWVPSLSLGVEIRSSWNTNDENSLLRTLSDTNFRLQAKHLVVVVTDEMNDETFLQLRKIEKRNVFKNLSILRVGVFGDYILKLMEIENGSKNS
jgi:hypothetical protein